MADTLNPHSERIKSLDGLRGIAILLVILFHTYARWADLLPWATTHKEMLVIRYGWLGVQLFFLISGFVIYLTLEASGSYKEFLFRRWLRLFPAALIATIIIYLSAYILPERPSGFPHFIDVLPSLTFLEPDILYRLFNIHANTIEGSLWALFVEVKFYFIFGALYFLNKKYALVFFTAIFLFYFLCQRVFQPNFPYLEAIKSGMNFLSLDCFGWFASGAWAYVGIKKGKAMALFFSIVLLPINIYLRYGNGTTVADEATMHVIYLLFILAFYKPIAKIYTSRFLVFIGFISYVLYLIHENAMVALTIKTHRYFESLPGMLTPLPGLVLLSLVAWIITRFLEPNLKGWIKRRVGTANPATTPLSADSSQ